MTQLYNKVKPTQLPQEIQDILNPQKKLPALVHFQMRKESFALWYKLSLFFGLPAFATGMVLLMGFIGDVMAGTDRKEQWTVIPVFAFPLIGISLSLFLTSIRSLFVEFRIIKDKWRRGVFLLPDALLIREKAKLCYLIPRSFIEKISQRNEQSIESNPQKNSVTEIYYKNSALFPYRLDLFNQDYPVSNKSIFQLISNWHQNF